MLNTVFSYYCYQLFIVQMDVIHHAAESIAVLQLSHQTLSQSRIPSLLCLNLSPRLNLKSQVLSLLKAAVTMDEINV